MSSQVVIMSALFMISFVVIIIVDFYKCNENNFDDLYSDN